MPRPWSKLSKSSRRLLAGGLALLVVGVAAVSLTIWDLRRVTLIEGRENVTSLGTAISEQTSRSLQTVDLEIENLQRDIPSADFITPETFASGLATEAMHRRLKGQANDLPQAKSFLIIGADGNLVVSSRTWPPEHKNFSDRAWYKSLSGDGARGVIISEPAYDRESDTMVIFLARRVESPSGEFLGLITCLLDLSYFRDFYKTLTASTGTSVGMLSRRGRPLIRYPMPVRPEENIRAGSVWFDIVADGFGVYEAASLLTPDIRVISVHALSDYPIVVDVSFSKDTILAIWRREAFVIGLGTVSAVLCVLLLLRALALQFRRLESQAIELTSSQAKLVEQGTELQITLDHMNQGLIMVDADHVVAVCNRRAVELLELPTEFMAKCPTYQEMISQQWANGGYDNRDPGAPEHIGTASVVDYAFTYERKRPNGKIIEIQNIPLPEGGMVRTFTDITDRRQSEAQVQYLARHDDLTKLINRYAFDETLQAFINSPMGAKNQFAVLYLDLDRFKSINDTRGHAVGDKLLAGVAARMRNAVSGADIVARMGGDEFGIIQHYAEQPQAAAQLAERLLRIVSAPYDIDGMHCLVGASIGIALFPDDGDTATNLLRNADTALYRAKSAGRSTFRLFDQSMDARQQHLFQLEQDLRSAVENDELEVVYQPIVDSITRQIVAFEALLRWHHKTLADIAPIDFIPLAEASGMIVPIGIWVLETACAEAASWIGNARISVNISPVQFQRGSLINQVKQALDASGLAPERLSLEITEGLLLEGTSDVLETMRSLRTFGVHFSLDDFGTAHAGLSYLRNFPFDALKIDKSFVQDAVSRPEARSIVEAILAMGTALKLNVIAEGVETEEQLNLLSRMKCPHVQGYLTGKPASGASARELIHQQSQANALFSA